MGNRIAAAACTTADALTSVADQESHCTLGREDCAGSVGGAHESGAAGMLVSLEGTRAVSRSKSGGGRQFSSPQRMRGSLKARAAARADEVSPKMRISVRMPACNAAMIEVEARKTSKTMTARWRS